MTANGEEGPVCSGGSGCLAPLHAHGCYADRGACDAPNEHPVADPVGESRTPYYVPPEGHEEDWFGPDEMNALRTEYALGERDLTNGCLATFVWNIRNTYLGIPEATFTNRQMQMMVEGFMAEVEALRAAATASSEDER